MERTVDYRSLRRTARTAGVLMLLMSVIAPFGMVFVPQSVTVPGDATATAARIAASGTQLRLAIAGDSAVLLIEVFLVVLVYLLFAPAGRTLSMVGAVARLAMTIVQALNILTLLFVLHLAGNAPEAALLAGGRREALMLLAMNGHNWIELVWTLFFALHLTVTGYLAWRSGYIPKWVGGALLLTAACYWVQGYGKILWPQHADLFTAIGYFAIIELVFIFWLVIRGVREPPASDAPA